MNRRHVLTGLGTVGLAGLSGCLGLAGLDEHEASPAGVEAEALTATGYGQTGTESITVDREVGPGPLSETIVVDNHLTEFEKSIDMGLLGEQRGAVFTVLSTPQVDIVGRTFNPVKDMSAAELVDLVENNYDDLSDVQHDDDRSVTVNGESTTQSRFTGQAEFNGTTVDVFIYITEAVETADDLLVTIGVYPQELRNQESANLRTLAEGVIPSIDDDAPDDPDEADGDEDDDDTDEDDEGSDGLGDDGLDLG
ncbi:DUF6517 family protein [Natrialbaceae archaeon A-arb3/5]